MYSCVKLTIESTVSQYYFQKFYNCILIIFKHVSIMIIIVEIRRYLECSIRNRFLKEQYKTDSPVTTLLTDLRCDDYPGTCTILIWYILEYHHYRLKRSSQSGLTMTASLRSLDPTDPENNDSDEDEGYWFYSNNVMMHDS